MFGRYIIKTLAAAVSVVALAATVSACGTRTATSVPTREPVPATRGASTRAAATGRAVKPLSAPATGRAVPAPSSASASSAVPVTGHSPVMTSRAAVAPARSTAGCYPLTDGGKCYSPGEFCRDDDHGTAGIDGDGNPVTCTDNDGWRWEAG